MIPNTSTGVLRIILNSFNLIYRKFEKGRLEKWRYREKRWVLQIYFCCFFLHVVFKRRRKSPYKHTSQGQITSTSKEEEDEEEEEEKEEEESK